LKEAKLQMGNGENQTLNISSEIGNLQSIPYFCRPELKPSGFYYV